MVESMKALQVSPINDDTEEGCHKSEHEKPTHRDGFPGSVEETQYEDKLTKDSDPGFHGSVDSVEDMESSTRKALQGSEIRKVESWAYISFSTSMEETMSFLKKLSGTCVDIGMGFYPLATTTIHVKPCSPAHVESALWRMHDDISDHFSPYGKEIGLVFVILPSKRVGDEIYGKCEKVCEKLGFVYHCCSAKDAKNPSQSYLKTTACEIINKVLRRDAVHNFVMPFSAKDDPTIVFGADIFRRSNISAVCVASTLDWPVSSRYYCLVAEQPCEEVTIQNLYNGSNARESMVRASILLFSKKTKILPKRIIFFRNGVDEGQFSFLSQEIDAIEKACTSIYKRALPITYVVVGRAEPAVGKNSSTMFEFSCCHQVVGETRTVEYRVLRDDNEYGPDKLRTLCTNLCTERVRWIQPEVSMVPPAYYARKAAQRAHDHFTALRAQTSMVSQSGTTSS